MTKFWSVFLFRRFRILIGTSCNTLFQHAFIAQYWIFEVITLRFEQANVTILKMQCVAVNASWKRVWQPCFRASCWQCSREGAPIWSRRCRPPCAATSRSSPWTRPLARRLDPRPSWCSCPQARSRTPATCSKDDKLKQLSREQQQKVAQEKLSWP